MLILWIMKGREVCHCKGTNTSPLNQHVRIVWATVVDFLLWYHSDDSDIWLPALCLSDGTGSLWCDMAGVTAEAECRSQCDISVSNSLNLHFVFILFSIVFIYTRIKDSLLIQAPMDFPLSCSYFTVCNNCAVASMQAWRFDYAKTIFLPKE